METFLWIVIASLIIPAFTIGFYSLLDENVKLAKLAAAMSAVAAILSLITLAV